MDDTYNLLEWFAVQDSKLQGWKVNSSSSFRISTVVQILMSPITTDITNNDKLLNAVFSEAPSESRNVFILL